MKKNLINQGIAAAKAGEKQLARSLLKAAAKDDPDQELIWLWLAWVAESAAEQRSHLMRVLTLNPSHERARSWLEKIDRQANGTQRPQPAKAAAASTNAAGTAAAAAQPAVESGQKRHQPAPGRGCPFCQSPAGRGANHCPDCGSTLTLVDLERFFRPADVDRQLLAQAVERLKVTRNGNGQKHEQLSLAYLNLRLYDKALDELKATARDRPRDVLLQRAIIALSGRIKKTRSKPFYMPGEADTRPLPHVKLSTPAPTTPTPTPGPDEAQDSPSRDARSTQVSPEISPQVSPAADKQDVSATNDGDGDNNQPLVLVVDDSPTVRKLVAVWLEKKGYQVLVASDGMEALAKFQEATPDLIFLDITMPRLDGYQVCKVIKQNDVTKHVPVVMLSGKDGFFDKVRGRMAGAVDHVSKPVDPDTLLATVEKYLTL